MPEFEIGHMMVLNTVPDDLLRRLPKEGQAAIRIIIGRPIMLARDSFGQAELELVDGAGNNHSIWIELSLLKAAPPKARLLVKRTSASSQTPMPKNAFYSENPPVTGKKVWGAGRTHKPKYGAQPAEFAPEQIVDAAGH